MLTLYDVIVWSCVAFVALLVGVLLCSLILVMVETLTRGRE